MDDNQQDGSEVLETTETEAEAVETTADEAQEDIEALRAKAAKADELEAKNKQLYERAKKAEAVKPAAEQQGYSLADLRAISTVHEEDVDRLERFAKAEGVAIRDAVKNPEWQAIAKLREENRTTATATNTQPVRRGPTKVTDDVLLDKARKGDLPDSEEEIDRIVAATAKRN